MNAAELTASTLALFAPPPRFNVAEWADSKRELARGTSPEPGKWRNSRTPYVTEVMESFTDSTVSETVLCVAAQLFKTSVIENAIGYFIDCDPCNILIKYPTQDGARRFSQKKLQRMIDAMPSLRAKVAKNRTRDSGNTIFSKLFPGGSISLVGANSAPNLRQLSCRVVIQDEIDSDEANKEGDPVSLADGRAERFHDAVFIKASTPTIKGASRIWALYEESDQRQWHVSCPKCSHEQVLKWSNVRWTWPDAEGKLISRPEDAVYVCDGCKAELSDFDRVRMVMQGRWMAKHPHRTRRGYHMSGLYSIMGKKRTFRTYLHEFVAKFLEAHNKGPEGLQTWTNIFLAECWEIQVDKLNADPIYLRREKYGPDLPKKVLVLTCAVDTQSDRIEYLVKGWGLGEESWGIETGRIMGNPFSARPWKALDAVLNKTWNHPLLGPMRIQTTVIDSGGQHDEQAFVDPVYKFVRPRQPRDHGPGVYAIKGASKNGSPLVTNRKPKDGICLKLIGTISAKLTVQSRLKLQDHGPRFIHYPDRNDSGFDQEFFAQLASEATRTVKKRGFSVIEFYKIRDRNEALDMEGYSWAALEILNPDLHAIAAQAKAKETELTPLIPEEVSPQKPRVAPREFTTPKLLKPTFGKKRFRRYPA